MVGMISQPGIWFEEMGLHYVGPIDGHDLPLLLETLSRLRNHPGAVLLHVITVKGKGYAPAENNPVKFHGVTPFDIKTGEFIKKPSSRPTYTKVFSQTMLDLAEIFPKLFAITAAMPEGTGLSDFSKIHPDRFCDVGIAEQHAVALAGGMAAQGAKPVVAIYSTFLQRAYDQLVHDICLQNLSVFFALDRGGLVGEDGPTHHGVFDIAYLRHIPNMVLMSPKDENELRHMMYTALRHEGPIAVRYPRGEGEGVGLEQDFREIPIGKAEVLSEGSDVTLLAYGQMVPLAVEVAKQLALEGRSVGVVNLRFAKPLDGELLEKLISGKKKLVSIEEGSLIGGVGAAILEWSSDHGLLSSTNLMRLGIGDEYVEHGGIKFLRDHVGLTSEKVLEKVRTWISGGN
jgi:1-deoxy-D-xylulose-5-phosphate synthase